MITLYHLGVSQSDRIVWLLEELGLPYKLEWYNRGEDGLAPPEYLALHPTATAPVIRDGDTVLAESAAICEYLCQRHGQGRFTVGPDQANYADYLYWMQMNGNLMALFFSKKTLSDDSPDLMKTLIERREHAYYSYIEQRLGEVDYLAGDEFTCADIMMMFNLTTLPLAGGRSIDDLPNTQAYVERVTQRPAYKKAMAIAGPAATPPN